MKNKHLTLSERITIQEMLERNQSFRAIAKALDKSVSSISREIRRNRYKKSKANFRALCVKSTDCRLTHLCGDDSCRNFCSQCMEVCNTDKCPEYEPRICPNHNNAPFVCNGCDEEKRRLCRYERYYYDARLAQSTYEKTLSSSREGVSLSVDEMEQIDSIVSPLLLNGHSLQAIYMQHKADIPCSMRTLYNYVDASYLTARNIDMPRKVRFKQRYRHDRRSKSMQTFCEGRKYADFKQFVQDNPDISVCEMDTVLGGAGSKKVFLTLLFRSCSFMLIYLLPDKTQKSVIRTLNGICRILGIDDFRRIFGVILTDRGTEFSNPYALECDENGEIKTRVFYCDPYCSWQKGAVEKNHEFIRYIVPTGRNFDTLRQSDADLIANNINNYPRVNLNNTTPYKLAELLIGKSFLEKLGYYEVPTDEVVLKPALLDKKLR
ncbi:MAG: IS30 family transposase [Eubacterium sp.]|nr:IS30 family transposase [Eubacterium sp.]